MPKLLDFGTYHVDETNYPAAWGARAFYHPEVAARPIDLVPERMGACGPPEARQRLLNHLNAHVPAELLARVAREHFWRGDEDTAACLYEDETVRVIASPQGSGGYLWVTAVLLPAIEDES